MAQNGNEIPYWERWKKSEVRDDLEQIVPEKKDFQKSTGDLDALKKLMIDDDERVVSVLGHSYLSSIFMGDGFDKSVLILTDKRVYQEGARYEKKTDKDGDTIWKKYKGRNVVSVRDVIAVSHSIIDPTFSAVIVTILSVVFVFLVLLLFSVSGFMTILIGVAAIGSGVVLLQQIVFATRKRSRILEIRHAGGFFGVDCDLFSETELRDFERSLFQLLDDRN